MKTSLLLLGLAWTAALPLSAVETAAPAGNRHLEIIQTEPLLYPLNMKEDGVRTGTVKMILHVGADGRLVDYLLTAYTRKPFAETVERVIPKWKFEPEYVDGAPVASVFELSFDFRVDGLMVVQKRITDMFRGDSPDDHFDFQARSLKSLDAIPTPLHVVNPAYPKEWADQGIKGVVMVDFYIDETGKVRMPAALAGADPRLAGLAVDAVEQWQFSPPTCKGRPALVHVQQRFDFK